MYLISFLRIRLIGCCRKCYAHSKIALVMQTRAIHSRHHSEGTSSFSLHPGVIPTNLQSADRTLFGTFLRKMVHWHIMPGTVTVADGARTTLFCATSPDAVKNSGQFFIPYGQVNHGPKSGRTTTKLWRSCGRRVIRC